MGITDAETNLRREEEKLKPDDIARSILSVGEESDFSGIEQKRNHREGRSRSNVVTGEPVTGGMLDHLINEYELQVAAREQEIARLQARVKELKSFKKNQDVE